MKKTRVCLFTRVSMVDKQNNDRQIHELTEYCKQKNYQITKTISSAISGTKTYKDRPDIKELLSTSHLYDRVLITETSRLGRCSKDIHSTISSLHQLKKAIIFKNLGGLESLDENGNESFVTNIIISIYSELAQEERRILVERVKSGIESARQKGRIGGKRKGDVKTKPQLLKEYSKLAKDVNTLSLNRCATIHKCSKNLVIKIKRLVNE